MTLVPSLWEEPPSGKRDYVPSHPLERPTKSSLQVPCQNVLVNNTSNNVQLQLLDDDGRQKLTISSQKEEPICVGRFHNRHVFQQQLIEKQKKKLQEQKKIILNLKEKQRLTEARWAAELATAVTSTQCRLLSNPKEESRRRCQEFPKYVHCYIIL